MTRLLLNPAVGELIAPLANEAAIEYAEVVADAAFNIAPVGQWPEEEEPGTFRDSIHVETAGEGVAVVADAVNRRGHPYAAYVELGTSFTPAHATLRRAVSIVQAEARVSTFFVNGHLIQRFRSTKTGRFVKGSGV